MTIKFVKLTLTWLLLTLFSGQSMALNQRDESLLWVGAEVFPALVKSVESINNSHTTIAVVYDQNLHQAEVVAKQLTKFLDQPIQLFNQQAFLQQNQIQIAFISHPLLHNSAVLNHIQQQKMLSFSPFHRAMVDGFDTGITIQTQVRPELHLAQLTAKGIIFKPFFVKVAHIYD